MANEFERAGQGSGPDRPDEPVPSSVPFPKVALITIDDVREVLRRGAADFQTAPIYGLVFGLFYVACGYGIVVGLTVAEMPYLIFPALAGFMLIGPISAVGIYEVSRRLETGDRLSWPAVFGAKIRHGATHLIWLGFALTFILSIWLRIAAVIYAFHFGLKPVPLSEMAVAIFTTGNGASFFLFGMAAGAVLASLVFSIAVVSVPFLLDKDVDFMTAMVASMLAFRDNPGPMVLWAGIIVVLVAASVATAFLGLIVVLPIIGHATWHLYRKVLIHPEDRLVTV
ncbi:MAG: DUF2189 domain-containing protein [Alphaproteobacteria bacterium]